MKKTVTLLSFFAALPLSGLLAQTTTMQIGATTVNVDTAYTGLTVPWEIQYGSDGHLWVSERSGIISRIHPTNHTKTVILDISSSVYLSYESGLLGFALHPDFPTTPEIFLSYVYNAANPKQKIVKYTYNGNNLVNETILIDNIDAGETHCGARFAFLADGTLLVTTGDDHGPTYPQDPNVLNGKILRMNTDGSIPSDNPTPGSYVYTLGHRNPQGLLVMDNGTIYISEHGNTTDDEFQIVEAGRNYGWPDVEGFCDTPGEQTFCNANNVKEPIVAWTPTIATSDIIYYENPQFPEWDQRILMTVLKDKRIIAMQLNGAGDAVTNQSPYLINSFGRLRDICVGPNKEIYIATNGLNWGNTDSNHSIIIIYPPGSLAEIKEFETNILVSPNPFTDHLTVTLDQTATGSTLQLSDLSGRILLTETVSQPLLTLETAQLPKGLYLLSLMQDGKITGTQKVLK